MLVEGCCGYELMIRGMRVNVVLPDKNDMKGVDRYTSMQCKVDLASMKQTFPREYS
jgi:hypothetical protein